MKSALNDSFFRFLFGFVAILAVSFSITFAIDYYTVAQEQQDEATRASATEAGN